MRTLVLCISLLFLSQWLWAQSDSVRRDTGMHVIAPKAKTAVPFRRTKIAIKPKRLIGDSARFQMDTGHLVFQNALVSKTDSVIPALAPPVMVAMNFDSLIFESHPFYRFTHPVRLKDSLHVRTEGKEELFYCITGLLLFFAFIRNAFSRYLQDLFRLFFRSTLKQRQAKEQLMEAHLPSLLLNLLFILSTALFLNLILKQFHLGRQYSFWRLFLYCGAGLAAIYLVKLISLKICGWIFRVTEATDTYTFIVFTTNKLIGIVLLPFIILLAFTSGTVTQVIFDLSLLFLGGLLLYRYYLSYTAVQRQVRLNLFHFVLYLFAFEMAPLLLINKLLLQFLG